MATVLQIQTALKALGYYRGALDGISGTYTIQAIKLFQKAKGLAVDGIAGPVTCKALGLTDASTSTSTSTSTGGSVQKSLLLNTGKSFSTFTQFYNLVKQYGSYSHYYDNQYTLAQEISRLNSSFKGVAQALNCVDYTEIGVKLAREMGYTATAYGIYCTTDKINHAIFKIYGKEFGTSGVWIDLAAAAQSDYTIGSHWCSGALTKEPSWIPYE